MLDDANTKTYINTDIASELGLQREKEKVKINVLNGHIETLETMPVNVTLESVNCHVNVKVNSPTTECVTGNMAVVVWNRCKKQWSYLQKIEFPLISQRPVVDVLIGLDCPELHCAVQEVYGRPEEQIARLTPLGWTCIGRLTITARQEAQTNFSCTYFASSQTLSTSPNMLGIIEDISSSS